jgi:hypothetical protein
MMATIVDQVGEARRGESKRVCAIPFGFDVFRRVRVRVVCCPSGRVGLEMG